MSRPTKFDIILDQKPLNEVEKPVGNIDLNSKRITHLANPVDLTDAVNKTYVDGIAEGLSWRPPARLIDSVSNFRPTGEDISIDGKIVNTGDRVLFTNLTMILEDDRVYRALGDGTEITGWGLETDGQAGDGSPTTGDALFIKDGDTYIDQGWVYAAGWIQFTGLGQITAGQGLGKNLNEIYIGNGDGIAIGVDNISLNIATVSALELTGSSPNKVVGVKVDNSSIEISISNALQVKAEGITQVHWKPTSDVNNNNKRISNVLNPAVDQDVATKKYVDDAIGTENLWDRVGTSIFPHYENDNIIPNSTATLGSDANRFSGLWLNGDVKTNADIEFETTDVGIILTSRTEGKKYRIFIDDNGVLNTEEIPEE